MTPEETRRRVRTHEAGHAISGRVRGLWDGPYVVARGDGSGETHLYPLLSRTRDRMTRAEWRTYLESSIILDRGGEAALEVFGFADPGAGAAGDRERARATAEYLDPAAVDATMARLYQRALALCRDNRAAIERMAATLAANGDRITGENEVRITLDAAMAGGPTPHFTGARPITRQDFLDQFREYRPAEETEAPT